MHTVVALASLNGWAETVLDSPYLYLAVGGVVVLTACFVIWRLRRKSAPKRPVALPPQLHPSSEAAPAVGPEKYAQGVFEIISGLGGKTKSVLLAGAGLESLPVTIAVKASIDLAKSGKKCLLVDLDTRRNAAAKVFDIHSENIKTPRPKPVATVIENLSLWPAEFFVRFARMNLQHIVQSSTEHYEVILINAPYLDGHPDRKLIASSAEYGLIFCQKPQQLERLTQLLGVCNCKVLSLKPFNQ